jgi:hypothetical protein
MIVYLNSMPPVVMPYGAAPAYCFPLTEYTVYVLFVICLMHAVRKGIPYVTYLIGGLLFGLLLEFVDVYFLKGYTYGRFNIMIGAPPLDIPFWIGVGWGVIIYSSRLYTERLGFSILVAAAIDSLLALNIDLTMDVTAYRLHMWDWGWVSLQKDPLNSQWFGIPYNNYFGWLMVVFSYSWFSRLFEKRIRGNTLVQLLYYIGVMLLSIFISEIILFSYFKYISDALQSIGVLSLTRLLTFLCFIIAIVVYRWNRRTKPVASLLSLADWIVPVWFHGYFFVWFFIAGFNHENPWMTIFAILNLIIGIMLHYGYFMRRTRQA